MSTWGDLMPGDTVVELDGYRAVYIIVCENEDIKSSKHWDALILYSEHPNNASLSAYRKHWIRCNAMLCPNVEVWREGLQVSV